MLIILSLDLSVLIGYFKGFEGSKRVKDKSNFKDKYENVLLRCDTYTFGVLGGINI